MPSRSLKFSLLAIAVLLGFAPSLVIAQYMNEIPARAKGIGVDEKLGGLVPLDLPFSNEKGEPCKVGDLFDGKLPVVLTLNYSGCPGLCVAQLDGLVAGVNDLRDLRLGRDFRLLSISIDPRETSEKAMGTKKRYTQGLDPNHEKDAWHFWTGSPQSIAKIAEAVGFRYTYDKAHDRYDHAAMAAAISPTGKITRYQYTIDFEPATFRLALVEASEGKIGTSFDQILLWCMHYDPNANRYSADARKLLSVVAGLFVLAMVGLLAPFWFSKKSASGSTPSSQLSEAKFEEPSSEDGSDPSVSENREVSV